MTGEAETLKRRTTSINEIPVVDATGGYGPSNTIVLGVGVLTTLMFAFFTSETYSGANGSG